MEAMNGAATMHVIPQCWLRVRVDLLAVFTPQEDCLQTHEDFTFRDGGREYEELLLFPSYIYSDHPSGAVKIFVVAGAMCVAAHSCVNQAS